MAMAMAAMVAMAAATGTGVWTFHEVCPFLQSSQRLVEDDLQ
jgi:hypothetical protein